MKIQTKPSGSPPPQKTPRQRYQPFKDTVELGASMSGGATVGYVLGALAGTGIHHIGGNVAYTYFGPAVGAVVCGTTGAAMYKEKSELWNQAALTTGLTTVGTVVGDALGHGLTHLTGNGLYASVGALVGGINGGMTGLNLLSKPDDIIGKGTKYTLPCLTGFTVGSSAGVLAGALLSNLTGSGIYNVVGPALGAVAGSVTGLALAVNYQSKPHSNHDNNQGGGD